MTGDQSRRLSVGARVCWGEDKNDRGTIYRKELVRSNSQMGQS